MNSRTYGAANHPRIPIGIPTIYINVIEVPHTETTFPDSLAPIYCEIRIDTPVPIPKKTHNNTSTGCELVPTAAKDVSPQYLPITSASTVVYNCCKTFPIIIGIANSIIFFII